MHRQKICPSKERVNYSQALHLSKQPDSFLARYFHSKQFAFPQLDQGIVNSKIYALTKLANLFEQETKDFKSWLLNKYPLSSYFKKIILEDKTTRILNHQSLLVKNLSKNEKSIYIGQTNSGMKHGYGFQIKVRQITNTAQEQDFLEFQAYEGFYANNLKHGKGKYFSNSINCKSPNFYYGKFINGQSCENRIAFMCWANDDFYIGKVKPHFTKQGLGVLFVSNKNTNKTLDTANKFNIKRDPYNYDKVVISDWQQNTTKTQNLQNSSSDFHNLLTQTKIISHNNYYFGQAYVYNSSKNRSHISIKEGTGFLKYMNGDNYQGSFTFDKINGYGKYIWQNQNYYIGEFLNGQKNGSGFWKEHSTNDQYQGEYHNNKRNGKGQYRWGNGNVYNGEFKNDLRQGQGKMMWATGQIYQGSWKDGLQNGIGKLYFTNGDNHIFVRESQFINGIQMQLGQIVEPLPQLAGNKKDRDSFNKSRRNSNLQSSRRKSLPNETQFKKDKKSSSLPKISEKTAMKFGLLQKSQTKSKTEQNQKTQQKIIKKSPKLASIVSKHLNKKAFDYTQTQKLPYHRSVNQLCSKTQKIERNKMSSYFSSHQYKQKKKKTFFIDVSVDEKMASRFQSHAQKQTDQNDSEDNLPDKYRKLNDILADSLLLPIKWRNIKRKSHNFILQRKQKRLNTDQSFS